MRNCSIFSNSTKMVSKVLTKRDKKISACFQHKKKMFLSHQNLSNSKCPLQILDQKLKAVHCQLHSQTSRLLKLDAYVLHYLRKIAFLPLISRTKIHCILDNSATEQNFSSPIHFNLQPSEEQNLRKYCPAVSSSSPQRWKTIELLAGQRATHLHCQRNWGS